MAQPSDRATRRVAADAKPAGWPRPNQQRQGGAEGSRLGLEAERKLAPNLGKDGRAYPELEPVSEIWRRRAGILPAQAAAGPLSPEGLRHTIFLNTVKRLLFPRAR